ncbi:spondin domain-containing protein [Flammeovirga yaeyamensis]|uniref:Spondin domain-containing protein n=1 Tax=Flammeovirga yaeyamensis TaxID=367791 RepID=A0AAX1NBV3_9BACT|nr:spondin domain-containing protein [Flammeovirga yaeyamensis]MBB3699935.1 hypothetical protein [Flammeovirga yaeyamensis]NMF37626.1 hypothetical protein [Flammeovirga yaeyamensis]QWG04682.1 spondin domain-containing protein [Flammeovirga yaeyamensis]
MKTIQLLFIVLSIFMFTACSDDENDDPVNLPAANEFTVTIENIAEGKDFFAYGSTGLITPGNSESFSFNAGKGHYLNFATMFVQSNDLFYAPSDAGIALYDSDGNAVTGDITSQFYYWDAGTEVNQEPGVGADQAPRQSGPNTGTAENGTIQLLSMVNDGYTYPTLSDVIKVSIAHDGGTLFTVTVENKSNTASLASPFAPGSWVVHSSGQYPLFKDGATASSNLEGLAEDGNLEGFNTTLGDNSGLVSPFAPGAYSVGKTNELFMLGQTSTEALMALAEDGNASGFAMHFNTPDQGDSPAPIFPNQSYSFTFTAEEGDYLSLATMLVQSNDWFIGFDNLKLYNGSTPLTGDITNSLMVFDSGTELDEYAGAGNYQAPRQPSANSGMDENGVVSIENDLSSNVPDLSQMVRVTITAN